jgi:ketosteroid isomerase-like protein
LTDAAGDDAPHAVLARLNVAVNRRDLAALVACFAPDYESEQPAHPDRRFRGAAQVERNWAAMFAGLPDFRAEVLRTAVAEDGAWVEWRWTGTRADGSRLEACGACIFGVRGGRVAWGRLYMEEVEAGQRIEAAVAGLAAGEATGEAAREAPASGPAVDRHMLPPIPTPTSST